MSKIFNKAALTLPYNPQPRSDIYEATRYPFHPVKNPILEDVQYTSNGIFLSYYGIPYRRKGFSTLETMEAVCIIKKAILLVFSNPFALLNLKRTFNKLYELSDYVLDNPSIGYLEKHSLIFKDEYFCKATKEIYKFFELFLKELGLRAEMAKILAYLLEIDNAYRYRLQELAGDTTKEKLLKHPIKEIRKLIKITTSRDLDYVAKKTTLLPRLLSLALILPRLRKAFKKGIKAIDLERIKLDDADIYFCLLQVEYNFFGMNLKDRELLFKQEFGSNQAPLVKWE